MILYNNKEGELRARWVFLPCIALSLLVSSARAYDTKGKFGMGVGFWATPILTYSSMKFCISNKAELEPSLGYHQFSTSHSSDNDSDSHSSKMTTSLLILSVLSNFKAIKAERSNLVLKIGGAIGRTATTYSDEDHSDTYSYFNIALLGGVGIEHFVNDNFAINVGTLSGLWNSSHKEDEGGSHYESSVSFTTFGNQLADFSLVWYLK